MCTFRRKGESSQLQAAMASLAQTYADVPWSCSAVYEHAVMVRRSGDLTTAHSQARQGAERFPDSMGAALCSELMADLERPNYRIHAMRIDCAQKQSLRIEHANMRNLYFRRISWNSTVISRMRGSRAGACGAGIYLR